MHGVLSPLLDPLPPHARWAAVSNCKTQASSMTLTWVHLGSSTPCADQRLHSPMGTSQVRWLMGLRRVQAQRAHAHVDDVSGARGGAMYTGQLGPRRRLAGPSPKPTQAKRARRRPALRPWPARACPCGALASCPEVHPAMSPTVTGARCVVTSIKRSNVSHSQAHGRIPLEKSSNPPGILPFSASQAWTSHCSSKTQSTAASYNSSLI